MAAVSFDEVFEQEYARLVRVARLIVGDEGRAREIVQESFARALVPGGQLLLGTHVGDGDVVRTEAYGGVPVKCLLLSTRLRRWVAVG